METENDWFIDIANNADFYSHCNQAFFVDVLEHYNYQVEKPIVFVPCASTKPISKSRTHCYLSPITRNPLFEIIIVSEPQSIIPYNMEAKCPNYDYPPESLTERDRLQMVRRINFFLDHLYQANQSRHNLYYIGGKHHLTILTDANNIHHHFSIISCVPNRGIRDYYAFARIFQYVIQLQESLENKKIKINN